MGGTN